MLRRRIAPGMSAAKPSSPTGPRPSSAAGDAATRLRADIRCEWQSCVSRVRQYVAIRKHPEVFVVAGDGANPLTVTALPVWTRAVTLRSRVFVLADRGPWSRTEVRRVLCHELFHASIWIYLDHRAVLPWWFNEAAAHWVVMRECGPSAEPQPFRDVCRGERHTAAPVTDAAGEPSPLSRAFSEYLLRNYQPDAMRDMLWQVKAGGDFEAAASAVFDLNGFASRRWEAPTFLTPR